MYAFVQFVFYFLIIVNSIISSAILHSKQGVLKGEISKSRKGRTFYSFYGIPYAEPPVGELRFQNPVPAKSWKGIRDGTVLPPPCLNFDFNQTIGEEDCLYLNVYSPKIINVTSPLPVMVFIYGSHFMYGNALPNRYGPHYFMDRDVVLITYHYRLGILGFLSTEDETIPGNYGLKDGVSVLQWIQKYIDDFGGDKTSVTVMGGSSGSMSAALNLISPTAEGLFHRVISQSGLPYKIEKPGKARLNAWKIASSVGCHLNTSEALLECLKNLPAQDLVAQNSKLFTLPRLLPIMPWGPVIESEKVPGAFLVDEPKKLLQRKSNIPWIFGMNKDEGGMLALFLHHLPSKDKMSMLDELKVNYKVIFPSLLLYDDKIQNGTATLDSITEKLICHYFGEKNITQDIHALSKMITSLIYPVMIKKCVELYKGPKYVYYYAYKNQQSFVKMYSGRNDIDIDMGVIHGDELISFYNWSSVITPVTDGLDLTVSKKIIELWTNFAATGDPNPPEEIIWRPAESSDDFDYLHIENGNFETKNEFLKEELDFLKSVFLHF